MLLKQIFVKHKSKDDFKETLTKVHFEAVPQIFKYLPIKLAPLKCHI